MSVYYNTHEHRTSRRVVSIAITSGRSAERLIPYAEPSAVMKHSAIAVAQYSAVQWYSTEQCNGTVQLYGTMRWHGSLRNS